MLPGMRWLHGRYCPSPMHELCKRCACCVLAQESRIGCRMLAEVAHLVDAVVPSVPLRHDVLSSPFELSILAASNPKVFRTLAHINYEVTAKYVRACASASTVVGKTHGGALTLARDQVVVPLASES